VNLDGKGEQVLLRDYQMHPFRPVVMHVDFQRVNPKEKIHMKCRCISPMPISLLA